MESLNKLILDEISKAICDNEKYFEIKIDEVLVEEEDYYSVLLSVTPKQVDHKEIMVVGSKQLIQVDVIDCIPHFVIGEDTEMAISEGNFYSIMYFGEIVQSL